MTEHAALYASVEVTSIGVVNDIRRRPSQAVVSETIPSTY